MANKQIKKYIIVFLVVFIALSANFAYAESSINFNVNFPRIPAPVPGGFFDLNCIEGLNTNLCSSEFHYAPSIGNIVLLIFSGAIWLAGLIAFGVLLYAGFLYIFAGSAPGNKSKAKEMFVNVTWGIGILLLSVVTLNLINPDIANLKTAELEPVSVDDVSYTPVGTQSPMPEPINTSGKFGCVWDPNGSPSVCIDGIKEYPPEPACKTAFMGCTGGLPYILCEGITDARLCNEFKEVYCDLGETGGPYDLEHPPSIANLIGQFARCMASCIAQFPGGTTEEIQKCADTCWNILDNGEDGDTGGDGGTGGEGATCPMDKNVVRLNHCYFQNNEPAICKTPPGRGSYPSTSHSGYDIGAPFGTTPVVAVESGVVIATTCNRIQTEPVPDQFKDQGTCGSCGNGISLYTDLGTFRYCHLSRLTIRAGENVVKGQQLGFVGMTGNAAYSHVHFGYFPNIRTTSGGSGPEVTAFINGVCR